MYQTKTDVLEALRSGKLLPKICQPQQKSLRRTTQDVQGGLDQLPH